MVFGKLSVMIGLAVQFRAATVLGAGVLLSLVLALASCLTPAWFISRQNVALALRAH
ncbi:MAG: hypothetical protein WDO56_11905 [Gammaproteobacteria bacterium]